MFATTALACAITDDLATAIALRAIQGFAAGGFNPAAFVAVFMVLGRAAACRSARRFSHSCFSFPARSAR